MSSLVVPIACWQSPPQSELTCAVASDDGERVVTGSQSGAVVIYGWPDPAGELRRQPAPLSLSLGHRSAVACLALCRIETDGPAAKANTVASATCDGEIAVWDLEDGRCLQSNPSGFPGVPRGILMSSGGRFLICYGLHEFISVMDASTLEVVRMLAVVPDQWIASLSLFPTENKSVDHILAVTFDGWVHQLMFDQDTLQLSQDAHPQHLIVGASLPALDIEHNRFDKCMFFVLQHQFCSIYRLEGPTAEFLARFQCPDADRSWAGARFLSARSVMLWTVRGAAFVYYLGPEADLRTTECAKISRNAIVLLSDGVTAVYVDRLDIGASNYQAYKTPVCIGRLDPGRMRHPLACFVPASPSVQQSQMLLHFETLGGLRFRVHQTHFWASLFGSNVSHVHIPDAKHAIAGLAQAGSPLGELPVSTTLSLTSVGRASRPDTLAQSPSQPHVLYIPAHYGKGVLDVYGLADVWPMAQISGTRATCCALVLKRHVALGHEDGSIIVAPLSAPLAHSLDNSIPHMRVLAGHASAVTAMFVPAFRADGVRSRLLTGSQDGTVKLWDVETGEELGSFPCHSMAVLSFTPLPAEIGGRFKAAVVSVSADNSVAVIDVDDAVCHYKFAGHASPVEAVYIRPLDDIFVVECASGTLYAWQIKTGHLDRTVTGALADDVLAGCEIKAPCGHAAALQQSGALKRTLAVYSVAEPSRLMPMMLVYQVNVKRLIDDIANGEPLMTPSGSRKDLDGLAGSSASADLTDGRDSASFRSRHSSIAGLHPKRLAHLFNRKRHGSRTELGSVDESRVGSPKLDRGSTANKSPVSVKPASAESPAPASLRGAMPDSILVQSIFTALLSWGISHEMDQLYSQTIGLEEPAASVSLGFRGANGWTVSGSLTAARLLSIMALSKSVLATKGLEAHASQLLTHYGAMLPSLVGPLYKFPSFSLLAKYWKDPVVPSVCKKMTKVAMRAALILGIIGSTQPDTLNVRVRKDVAESLEAIIREDTKSTYRLIAIELMGRGFATWEPHINGANVLRCLVGLTGLVAVVSTTSAAPGGASGLAPGSSVAATASVPALPGSPFSSIIPGLSGGSLAGAGGSQAGAQDAGSASQTATPTGPGLPLAPSASGGPASGAGPLTPATMLMARQALVAIASVNAPLFISTLTFDLVHARVTAERGGSLKLLGMLISKKPVVLYPHLSRIVDSMVKTLDPNTPQIRESLQQIVTVNFAELVRTYPCVSFHAGTQRLAVGSAEGSVVVYDLRTATKGHTRPVHAVSFSSDGKLIASFSVEENCVKIWQPHAGFFGTLVGALSGTAAGNATGAALASVSGAGHLKCFRSFSVGAPVAHVPLSTVFKQVKFVWVGERAVKVCSLSNVELMFNV
ncbi:hypothetical protein HK105_209296 [Polyrhizophydium stewartii]|uniref:WD40 repeat-like protein n=1 Tax=Polyrhizophydium stewartii TaxID=2732419 RepID=A0ABR4MVD8_9FUNG